MFPVLIVWFAGALWLVASGIFSSASPLQVAATVWGLTALLLLLIATVPRLRSDVNKAGLPWLIRLHLVRFVGLWFMVLYFQGRFPFDIGIVGGAGDALIATAALV